MATVEVEPLSQPLQALARANRARCAGAAVRREMKAGTLTLADALFDERSDSLKVLALVMYQPGWGAARSAPVLARERIPETKRVGSLTTRQRDALAEACS